jgi:glycosyltransferase involved in cell wall biosynthesis
VTTSTSVSVIIPVFNDQAGLQHCLETLAEQDWPRELLEVIVVDNGSSPPIVLESACADFARIAVCLKTGAYAARNLGISLAHGEVLAFTDADCIPDKNWIRAGVAALYQQKERAVIGGNVILSLSAQPTAIELYQYLTGFMQRENIEHLGFSATANLFVTRAQLAQIGLFDESLLSGGDREWSWRAAYAGFTLTYAGEAIVRTMPRISLKSAIRQARRVIGGREALRQHNLAYVPAAGLKPHRSVFAAAKWILFHPQLSIWNRVKVFSVALLLKIIQILEVVRLKIGLRPERR